jgi:hypothetical protein
LKSGEAEAIALAQSTPHSTVLTAYSGEPGGVLRSVVYGNFTSSSSREALVDFMGCEPHASSWGGSALLRRSNSGWSFVRYEKGLRSSRCLKFPERNGRNSLVCHGSWMGQGYLSQWLEAKSGTIRRWKKAKTGKIF